MEEAICGSSKTQSQDTGLFIGDGGWNRRQHVLSHYRIELESSLGRTVDLFCNGRSTAADSVAYPETLHVGTDLDDFTGNIGAENEWILDITGKCWADVLQHPVERVDSHGCVFDYDLA